MIVEEIQEFLFQNQDKNYREFQRKLIPTVDPKQIIGVRTPVLRSYSKGLMKDSRLQDFLRDLPHKYFEENQLHGIILSSFNDFDRFIVELEYFMPYIDNWATTDIISPRAVKGHLNELYQYIRKWIKSDHDYTLRLTIGLLMKYYLEDEFKLDYPQLVASIRSEAYYVNMMIAWYFATALAKQYDQILPFIEEQKLDLWTHNKTIQKAVESRRISPEQKDYLRTLRQKS